MQSSRHTRFKKLSIILSIALTILISVQFTSPEVQNRPYSSREIIVPKAVKTILERSCYNCHSNHSELKWFDRIAPVSHLVAHDIKEARSRFNFSEWDTLLPAQQQVILWEVVNAIEQKKMPLNRYLVAHPEANISPSELATLKLYVNTLSGRTKVDTTKIIRAANIPGGTMKQANQALISSTGISYSDDYKTWKVISATDKYDGGSMRIVYGNDIMIKALKDRQLPFPDGAKMVKAVWGKQLQDKEGNVFPGNFQNVQFMVKDRKRFKSTQGWGFARFDGLKLKPFGKAAAFAQTCINCHRLLVAENDFVFNIPYNEDKLKKHKRDVK
jgi:hypothetical protein